MPAIPRLAPFSRVRRVAHGLLLGAVVAAGLALLRSTDLMESLEMQVVDLRTRHVADARTPDERIVLMQVEESDVQAVRLGLGVPWPWPLEINRRFVEVLNEAGAAALVVDVLHLDRGAGPDDVPSATELSPVVRQQREGEAAEAALYGQMLLAFGKAAVAFELSNAPEYEVPARVAAAQGRLEVPGLVAGPETLARRGANLPVRRVAEGAALLGFANAVPDADGVVRRAAVLGRWGARSVLSLPLAAATVVSREPHRSGSDASGGAVAGIPVAFARSIAVGAHCQRLHDDASFLVNHHAARYPRVAPVQVLAWAQDLEAAGELPAASREALQGKIVVFGVNLAGQRDVLASPLGGSMDGPVFQATVLDNLLHGDGRVYAARRTNLAILLGLAILAALAGLLLPTRWMPHLVPLAFGATLVASAFAIFRGGVSLDVVTPVLALLLTWGGTFALRAFTEGRRNRWLGGTFGRYMAPPLIAALKRDPTLLALGGRTREVSLLFSDVAGFTRLSERLAAGEVVRLLNRYLTAHCAAVMDEGGVVDKFEGDAVMAFFGDPVEQADHALRACRAALRIQRDLPNLQPVLDELGVERFTVRVGLNTGEAVVGNMGSDQRFDYTCMGDSVNLASRIEGAAKAFGAPILVGAATAAAAGDAVLCKPLGEVVVVGRERAVAVCELLAERARAGADLVAHAEAFGRALQAAGEGDVAGARAALAEAARLRPGDGPCAWFARVLDTLEGPWSGRTVLATK